MIHLKSVGAGCRTSFFRKAHDLAEKKAKKFKEDQAAGKSGATDQTAAKDAAGPVDKSGEKKIDENVGENKKKK